MSDLDGWWISRRIVLQPADTVPTAIITELPESGLFARGPYASQQEAHATMLAMSKMDKFKDFDLFVHYGRYAATVPEGKVSV